MLITEIKKFLYLPNYSKIIKLTAIKNNVLNIYLNIYSKMSQTKREQVVSHIRYLRQELREMHQGIQEDGFFPEPGELRGILAQMEALLELLEGNQKIKPASDLAWFYNLKDEYKTSKNKISDIDCR